MIADEEVSYAKYVGPALPVHSISVTIPRVTLPANYQKPTRGRTSGNSRDTSEQGSFEPSTCGTYSYFAGSQSDLAAVHDNWMKYQKLLDGLEAERITRAPLTK